MNDGSGGVAILPLPPRIPGALTRERLCYSWSGCAIARKKPNPLSFFRFFNVYLKRSPQVRHGWSVVFLFP